MLGEILKASPIALKSRYKLVPEEPITIYGHFAPRHGVLLLGVESAAAGLSQMAPTDQVHSAEAITPGLKFYLLMYACQCQRQCYLKFM